MPSTSPYMQNDYAAANTLQPYNLPTKQIFRALAAENQFWEQGAQRIKSVYDNALELKLTLEPNKQIRDQFMKESEKQISKLSTMNVADPSVQRQGFDIFKPLFKDEGIIYDDAYTRHVEKVRADALSYRDKDDGKFYSDDNMKYALDGYEEFANSNDRMAGKKMFAKRREYTPFYDYTLDYERALKDCEASSNSQPSPVYSDSGQMTGYMKTVSTKFRSIAQSRNCIESGINPKALRQMQIEGSVRYKGNEDVLGQDVGHYLSGVNANLTDNLQELGANKAKLLKDNTLSDADKQLALKAIEQQMKSVSDEMLSNSTVVGKIQSGDLSPVKEHFDEYAGAIYSYKKILKRATAVSFTEDETKLTGDPVQLSHIKFEQEKYLKGLDYTYDKSLDQMKYDNDVRMEYLKASLGAYDKSSSKTTSGITKDPKTGDYIISPDLQRESSVVKDGVDPKTKEDYQAYDNLKDRVNEFNTMERDNNSELWNGILEKGEKDKDFRATVLAGFNYGNTDNDWERFKKNNNRFKITSKGGVPGGLHETSWFKAYASGNSDDEIVNSWADKNTQVAIGLKTLNRKIEIGEKEVDKNLGITNDEAYKDIKPTKVDGIEITAKDIKDALEGKPSKITAEKMSVLDRDSHDKPIDWVYRYKLGDKILTSDNAENFTHVLTQVKDKMMSIDKGRSEARAKVYGREGFAREPWFFTHDDESPTVEGLRGMFPGKAEDLKNIRILKSDFAGGIVVSLPGKKKDVMERLKNSGFGTSVEPGKVDGTYVIKGTNYNVVPQAINNPILKEAAYQMNTIAETRAFSTTPAGGKVPDADIKVPVMVQGKQQMFSIETYKKDGRPLYKVFADGASTSKPLVVSTDAYDLFEQFSRMGIKLKAK